jgi:hypothetical protein
MEWRRSLAPSGNSRAGVDTRTAPYWVTRGRAAHNDPFGDRRWNRGHVPQLHRGHRERLVKPTDGRALANAKGLSWRSVADRSMRAGPSRRRRQQSVATGSVWQRRCATCHRMPLTACTDLGDTLEKARVPGPHTHGNVSRKQSLQPACFGHYRISVRSRVWYPASPGILDAPQSCPWTEVRVRSG